MLYEDYPPHYLINVRRSHRWVRGDWQLLPWLLMGHRGAQQQRRLALIDRWKMLDNLRRSLLPLALLCLFIAAWTVLPGSPLLWTLVGLLVPAQPLITDTLTGLLHVVQQGWRRRSQQVIGQSCQGRAHILAGAFPAAAQRGDPLLALPGLSAL